jgi:hypothetical protein
MMRAVGMALALLGAAPALRAADLPCPPRQPACWQVRLVIERYGQAAAIAHARACGWTEAKITEARKCLK